MPNRRHIFDLKKSGKRDAKKRGSVSGEGTSTRQRGSTYDGADNRPHFEFSGRNFDPNNPSMVRIKKLFEMMGSYYKRIKDDVDPKGLEKTLMDDLTDNLSKVVLRMNSTIYRQKPRVIPKL